MKKKVISLMLIGAMVASMAACGSNGGDKGGTVVACGTPEEVAENPNSYTGKYIKMMLDRK